MTNSPPRQNDGWDIASKVALPLLIFGLGTHYSCSQSQVEREDKVFERTVDLIRDSSDANPTKRGNAIQILDHERKRHPDLVPDYMYQLALTQYVDTENRATSDTPPDKRDFVQLEERKAKAIELSKGTDVAAAVKAAATNTVIFLQIPNESFRPLARDVTAGLKTSSYDVPGIEDVGPEKSPDVTQVRYFRKDADTIAAANAIANRLRELNIPNPVTVSVNMNAGPNQFEVWFGKDRATISSPTPTPVRALSSAP